MYGEGARALPGGRSIVPSTMPSASAILSPAALMPTSRLLAGFPRCTGAAPAWIPRRGLSTSPLIILHVPLTRHACARQRSIADAGRRDAGSPPEAAPKLAANLGPT